MNSEVLPVLSVAVSAICGGGGEPTVAEKLPSGLIDVTVVIFVSPWPSSVCGLVLKICTSQPQHDAQLAGSTRPFPVNWPTWLTRMAYGVSISWFGFVADAAG